MRVDKGGLIGMENFDRGIDALWAVDGGSGGPDLAQALECRARHVKSTGAAQFLETTQRRRATWRGGDERRRVDGEPVSTS
jgi:hypothetical protein